MRPAYNDAGSESPSPLPSGPPRARRAHIQPEGLWGGVRGGGSHNGRGLRLPPSPTLPHKGGGSTRAVRINALRQVVAKLETVAPGAKVQHLSLGVPEIEAHLPGPGLACGVLHEMAAAAMATGRRRSASCSP